MTDLYFVIEMTTSAIGCFRAGGVETTQPAPARHPLRFAGNHHVAAGAPIHLHNRSVRAIDNEPGASRRSPHRNVCFSVTVVVCWRGDVCADAPAEGSGRAVRAIENPPDASRRPPDGDVGLV